MRSSARHARGFTLLELTLASVAGAMILLVAVGLMATAERMDRTAAASFSRAAELSGVQTVCRRAFLSLVLRTGNGANSPELVEELRAEEASLTSESATERAAAADPADTAASTDDPADAAAADAGPPVRPQIALEPDPAAGVAGETGQTIPAFGGAFFQRLEMELSGSPVPPTLASQAAGWASRQDDYGSLNFITADGSAGRVRGVFELRPDGQRERVLRRLGLGEAAGLAGDVASVTDELGWTLWWRRVPAEEADLLAAGRLPWADGTGDLELERRRLAGAVPLVRGLRSAGWSIFKLGERLSVYRASHVNELPAYAELRLETLGGSYHSWLFEVDWTVESAAQRAARLAADTAENGEGGGGSDGGSDGGSGGGSGGGGSGGAGGGSGDGSGDGANGARPTRREIMSRPRDIRRGRGGRDE